MEELRGLPFERMVARGLADSREKRAISNEDMSHRIGSWRKLTGVMERQMLPDRANAKQGEEGYLMAAEPKQAFGGHWTEIKLEMLTEYLAAYTSALKNQPFGKIYVDAFAGTGYREMASQKDSLGLFAEQAEAEADGFFDGSAKIALQTDPAFDRYIFIERKRSALNSLESLCAGFPDHSIDCRQGDANELLPKLLKEIDWKASRAVLFLDPFGMNVDWSTMEAVAATRAIDVWILFPAGVGVNRMLTDKPEDIPGAWRARLDRVFGTAEWSSVFYRTDPQGGLFDEEQNLTKVPDAISKITGYYHDRLREIFPRVADNPRPMSNSKQSPMFVFTFAISNPGKKAQDLALKIAGHILGKKR
jgi:three-Cys-motif partner protein